MQIQEAQTQLIDLSEKATKPKVVREGYQVPAPALDQRQTDFLVNQMVPVTDRQLPRVFSQSIPAGTKVMAGTVVDLVMAPRTDIPFDVFNNVHADLKGKAIPATDNLVDNATVRQILLTYDSADDVPAAQKQQLITAFGQNGITVNDSDPTRTFQQAYDAVRGAVAFR